MCLLEFTSNPISEKDYYTCFMAAYEDLSLNSNEFCSFPSPDSNCDIYYLEFIVRSSGIDTEEGNIKSIKEINGVEWDKTGDSKTAWTDVVTKFMNDTTTIFSKITRKEHIQKEGEEAKTSKDDNTFRFYLKKTIIEIRTLVEQLIDSYDDASLNECDLMKAFRDGGVGSKEVLDKKIKDCFEEILRRPDWVKSSSMRNFMTDATLSNVNPQPSSSSSSSSSSSTPSATSWLQHILSTVSASRTIIEIPLKQMFCIDFVVDAGATVIWDFKTASISQPCEIQFCILFRSTHTAKQIPLAQEIAQQMAVKQFNRAARKGVENISKICDEECKSVHIIRSMRCRNDRDFHTLESKGVIRLIFEYTSSFPSFFVNDERNYCRLDFFASCIDDNMIAAAQDAVEETDLKTREVNERSSIYSSLLNCNSIDMNVHTAVTLPSDYIPCRQLGVIGRNNGSPNPNPDPNSDSDHNSNLISSTTFLANIMKTFENVKSNIPLIGSSSDLVSWSFRRRDADDDHEENERQDCKEKITSSSSAPAPSAAAKMCNTDFDNSAEKK